LLHFLRDILVMIRLALLTSNIAAADTIERMAQDSSIFELVHRGSPDSPPQALLQALLSVDPDVILLDVNGGQNAAELATRLNAAGRASLVGFRGEWTLEEQNGFAEAGICTLLREPFSASELEAAAYGAVHLRRPIVHQNVIAFLPSKPGSGCSTVALNTAAALANDLKQRTLLVEADRRSGALSILLDVEDRGGLAEVLAHADLLTGLEWRKHLVSIGKLDLLLANPFNPGALPTWVNYYQMLSFVENQYDFIVVDLPEVADSATAELLRAARLVFIVCEPEVTSLKLVRLRRTELESIAVPREKICVLGNRWESHLLNRDIVQTTGVPMFAALPNDYQKVQNAALESRLVSRDSQFGAACAELARRLADLPETAQPGPVASLLRRFIKT
jgi:Mrp family chromosome partitioning ATPase